MRSHLCPGDHPKVQEEIHTKYVIREIHIITFTLFFNNNYLQYFIGEKIPKQSSSFSSPREINGSFSTSSSSSEEFATEDFDLEVRS